MNSMRATPDRSSSASEGDSSADRLSLEILHDSVQDLRDRVNKPPSRLSKWLPIAISAIALALSLVATVHGMLQDDARERSARRTELRTVLASLIETSSTVAEKAGSIEDLGSRSVYVSQAAAKVHLLAQEADRIFEEADTELTPAQYLVLGELFLQSGDLEKARGYMERGVAASQSTLEKAFADRSLAKVHFARQAEDDLKRGRELLAGAERSLAGSGHPYVVFQRGFTLETWAELEAFVGNEPAVSEKLRDAQQVYRSVPEADGGLHLRRVTTRLAQLGRSPGR